jgi:hypothetical protein
MVCFQTKNPNFGKIGRVLEYKMLLYFMTFWNILRPFGIIYSLLVCSLWSFGIFFSVLVYWTNKNLATLPHSPQSSQIMARVRTYAFWSSGEVSACGVMGREIESP